jgi:hypothetical protein
MIRNRKGMTAAWTGAFRRPQYQEMTVKISRETGKAAGKA